MDRWKLRVSTLVASLGAARLFGACATPRLRSCVVAAVWLGLLTACASAGGEGSEVPSGQGVRSDDSLSPPFIPIDRQYLVLPDGMQPVYPTFLSGDREILFRNAADDTAWIIRSDGSDLQCITCGFGDQPRLPGTFIHAFPDEQRLMLTPGVAAAADPWPDANGWILECAPSLRACDSHRFLPIDMSASRGEFQILQRRTWHLAPDGVHIGWMEVRADGTVMVLARLERQDDRYVAADPRAINPPGPTLSADDNADRWESLTQLYELKSFTPDGRGVVAVALPNNNVDMIRIDLATGRGARLTAHPDWDEDGSLSPDQQLLVTFSWRTRHRLDALAWIPEIRGFSGLMIGAAIAPYYVSTWAGFQCDLSPWLLPAEGDHGGRLLGQPMDVYDGELTAASHQQGYQNWSSDSTTLLLQERTRTQGVWSPNRIAMARLGRAPTKPAPSAATVVGDWAVPAALYRGPHAEERTVTVRGNAGGQATLALKGKLGGGGASTTVVFDRFTDDGATFVSGTMSQVSEGQGATERRLWTLRSDVTVTGRHTGSLHMDLRIDNAVRPLPVMTGSVDAVYDGRAAPPLAPMGPCYDVQPRPSPLELELRRIGNRIRATVTADVYGDVRPVMNATVRYGVLSVATDAGGEAVLPIGSGESGEVVATAGDTFISATTPIADARVGDGPGVRKNAAGGQAVFLPVLSADKHIYWFGNSSDTPVRSTVALRGRLDGLQLWNPHDGSVTDLEQVTYRDPHGGGVTEVELQVDPVSAIAIVGSRQ